MCTGLKLTPITDISKLMFWSKKIYRWSNQWFKISGAESKCSGPRKFTVGDTSGLRYPGLKVYVLVPENLPLEIPVV